MAQAKGHNIQVFGLIRFSFVAGLQEAEWVNKFKDREEQLAFLFDPKRIQQRFELFEALTLPSLRAQSDGEFTALILCSTRMPSEHQRRLKQLVYDIENIQLVFAEPQKISKVVLSAIEPLIREETELVVQFRMDDDDALKNNFIAAVREDAQKFAGPAVTYGVSYPHGITSLVNDGGVNHVETLVPFTGLGLAVVTRGQPSVTPFSYGHLKISNQLPIMTFPRRFMFIRTLHGGNDSRGGVRGGLGPCDDDRLNALFAKHYPYLDVAALNQVLTGPATGVTAGPAAR